MMMGGIEVLMFLINIFGGSFGIPMGVPPAPEDPVMLRVAPDECLFYSSWAGMAEIDPEASATEKWMAQEEIQKSFAKLRTELPKMFASEEFGGDAESAELAVFVIDFAEIFLTHPGATYISKFVFFNEDDYQLDGGLVLHLGDQASAFQTRLEGMMSKLPEDIRETIRVVEIDGKEYSMMPVEDTPLMMIWGIHDGYLYAATGQKSLEAMFANMKTEQPEWLTEIRERLKVDRISSTSYLNTEQLIPLAMMLEESEPEMKSVMDSTGILDVAAVGWVSGLNKEGFISRTAIDFEDGKLAGIFEMLDAEPIRPDEIGRVDKEAMLVVSHRVSTQKIYDFVMEMANEFEGQEELEAQMQQFKDMTGVDIKDEIIDSVDDLVTVYGSINLLSPTSGWVASAKIKNEMVFQSAYNKLNEFLENMADENDFEFKTQERRGKTIYSISGLDAMMPLSVEPSWSLDGGEIVFSLNRSAVSGHVRRDGVDETNNIAFQDPMKTLFAHANEDRVGPIGVMQFDIAQIVELGVSSLRGMVPDDMVMPGTDLSVKDIPTAEVLINGVKPNIAGVYRTPTGVELYQQQTYPGGSPGATIALVGGIALPATTMTRTAARRVDSANRIRQLAISMHNYHDAHRGLPPQFSTDDEGKPLLSWRVHILPYLGEQELYDEFHLDEPWDSDHNIQLIEKMPELFENPQLKLEEGMTCYLAAAGDGGMFGPPEGEENGDETPIGVKLEDVHDGTSLSIMLIEGNESVAVKWTEPTDFDISADSFLEMLQGVNDAGNNFAFGDGSVQMINPAGKHEILKKLFTISDGEDVDWGDWID